MYIVLSLFMLNFFLAIIIDAFTKVKTRIEDQKTEHTIMADSLEALNVWVIGWRRGWPALDELAGKIEEGDGDRVGLEELMRLLRQLGASPQAAAGLVEHYAGYSVLVNEEANSAQRVSGNSSAVDLAMGAQEIIEQSVTKWTDTCLKATSFISSATSATRCVAEGKVGTPQELEAPQQLQSHEQEVPAREVPEREVPARAPAQEDPVREVPAQASTEKATDWPSEYIL